jgi:hypothetical protein
MNKLTLLILFSIACSVVNGQTKIDSTGWPAAEKERWLQGYIDKDGYPYPAAGYLGPWMGHLAGLNLVTGSNYNTFIGEPAFGTPPKFILTGRDTLPLPKPKKPVKKKSDTAKTYFSYSLPSEGNTPFGGDPNFTWDEPYNPIPDILKRLDILEKQYQFLVRRTIEMQIEIDSLKREDAIKKGIHMELTGALGDSALHTLTTGQNNSTHP